MHRNLIDHENLRVQNKQLSTKNLVELKNNSKIIEKKGGTHKSSASQLMSQNRSSILCQNMDKCEQKHWSIVGQRQNMQWSKLAY